MRSDDALSADSSGDQYGSPGRGASRGHLKSCGFVDVRQRDNGQYYCTKCSWTWPLTGIEFDMMVQLTVGKKAADELRKRCADWK